MSRHSRARGDRLGLPVTVMANAQRKRRGLWVLDGVVRYMGPALITVAAGVWLYVLFALAAG